MSHVNAERLARLIDEAPSALERAHLDVCAECRRALEQQRAVQIELSALRTETWNLPWSQIAPELRRVGLLAPAQRWPLRQRWLQHLAPLLAAASIATVAFAAGRFTAPRALPPSSREVLSEVRAPLESLRVPTAVLARAPDGPAAGCAPAQISPLVGPADATVRLAALEVILAATGAALRQAPADRLLECYLESAQRERDLLLRRVALTGGETWF